MWWAKAFLVIACLGSGAVASVLLGQDANWDLLNYHIRDPYTVLNGRMLIDLDPASMQSYFNPTLDLLYYTLSTGLLAHSPRVLAAVMGLPFGALLLAALALSHRLFGLLRGFAGPVVTVLAAASAVTGAATLTQLGTTFNEVTIAALVLIGFVTALPQAGCSASSVGIRRMAAAGLLFGTAAGLKLTSAIDAPALCLTLLLFMPFVRWLRAAAAFSTGWAISFLSLAGWWSWQLYTQFGNPFFPLYNGLFRSPWYPPVNLFDTAYLPRTPLQWMFYPFWWLTQLSHVNAELVYRDPRLAFFLVAALVALLGMASRRFIGRDEAAPVGSGALADMVVVFTVIAYGFWLYVFAIMRYGIVLEVTGTLTVVLVIVRLAGFVRERFRTFVQAGLVAALVVFYGVWTRAPDYGHIAYGKQVFSVDMSWTPKDTLFIAITGPTAYVTAFVPSDRGASTIGFSYLNRLAADWMLTKRSKAIVDGHQGSIMVLVPPDDSSMLAYLPMIGLSPQLGPCRQISSNLDANRVKACVATKLPTAA